MRSPLLLLPARPVALAATLLALSGTAALSAAEVSPAPAAPRAENRPLDQAIAGAIALVHDGAGFAGELPIGTFSDGKPDTRAEMARAARHVPEVIAAAIRSLDPTAAPAAERTNEAAKLRLATFAGEHRFRRALAWYEPLLLELASDMPEPKLTPEQLKALRAQLREWQVKSPTYTEWARKKGGDLNLGASSKPGGPPKLVKGQGPFADVPVAHPAYGALQTIAKAGVFTGYPDNTFSGKRALTRYEFAVALQRVLQDVQRQLTIRKTSGSSGSSLRLVVGPPGPKTAPFDPTLLLRVMPWIRALTEEFDTELAMLGSDVEQAKKNLAVLEERIQQLSQPSAPGKPQGTAPGSSL